ncbi:MAG: thermonuclease family protein [Geminicoccaceae bacterium]
MTLDQIGQWFAGLAGLLWDIALWLVDGILAIGQQVTGDHIEGAGVMALILLGPSLVIGVLGGFWEGLRIEWRHYREQPIVIDGDTLDVRGERLRLFALDTPEMGQPWWDKEGRDHDAGRLAKEALERLVQGRRLSVRVLREGKYGRSIAIVRVDGRDIGRLLVSRGWAFAAPGSRRYQRAQAAARRRRKGLWRGELQMPWDYRAAA